MAKSPATTKSVKRGTLLVGKKHSEGGIPVINKSNPHQKIEVEGGEIVITAPAVEDTTLREFNGKMLTNRQILSQINQSGGGVALAKGGDIPKRINCSGKKYAYGGKMVSDYDIVSDCGCKHSLGEGGNIPASLVGEYAKVKLPSSMTAYDGHPEELVWFIQEQATGLDASRNKVHFPNAYDSAVNLVGQDLVLRAVAALPADVKQKVSKAWKGRIVPKELRNAVFSAPLGKETIKKELADGGSLDRRSRDYSHLQTGTDFSQTLARGGSVSDYKYPPLDQRPMVVNDQATLFDTDLEVPAIQRTLPARKTAGPVKNVREIEMSFKPHPGAKDLGRISSSSATRDFLKSIWDLNLINMVEQFYAVFLDQKHSIIGFMELSKGGVAATVVDPKVLAGVAAKALAQGVIVAHNHPSGSTAPSKGDDMVTKNLYKGLALLDIRLLDHVIITPGDAYYSYAENGDLNYERGGVIFKEGGQIKLAEKYANPYELNRAIEKLLDEKTDNSSFTVEEKDFIRYYSGYGGLEKFGAEGKGLLYEYFTPSGIAEKMWALAYHHGYAGGTVLEPSAGIGEFVKYAPDQSLVDAYEINKYSARILKILYPLATVRTDYFEELFIKNRNTVKNQVSGLKKYDLVIGNPPYGEFGGKFAGMGEREYTRAGNYIDYFIFRGLDLLRTGGLLIYVVGAEVAAGGKPFLQQQMNTCKKEIAEKADLIDAYRLPNGVFERTDVLTDIMVLRKK